MRAQLMAPWNPSNITALRYWEVRVGDSVVPPLCRETLVSRICKHFPVWIQSSAHWENYTSISRHIKWDMIVHGDSFPFNFEPNGIQFGSKSKGKLLPRTSGESQLKWYPEDFRGVPINLPSCREVSASKRATKKNPVWQRKEFLYQTNDWSQREGN